MPSRYVRHRRSGYRYEAVLASDHPRAFVQVGEADVVNIQLVDADRQGGDVRGVKGLGLKGYRISITDVEKSGIWAVGVARYSEIWAVLIAPYATEA